MVVWHSWMCHIFFCLDLLMNVMLASCNVMWGWAKQNALSLLGRCSGAEDMLSEDATGAWWCWTLLSTGFQLHLGIERRSRRSSSLNLVHCALNENQWCLRVCEERAWGQPGDYGLLWFALWQERYHSFATSSVFAAYLAWGRESK